MRIILLAACVGLMGAAVAKPNIVLLVADDMGYGELGAQGNHEIPTPAIDSLAKNGVRFTSAYVSAPLCAPSRAGFLTGVHGSRFGFDSNPPPSRPAVYGVPRTQPMIQEVLQKTGYKTAHIGKWHLGFSAEQQPNTRGFDFSYGFTGGARTYFHPRNAAPILRDGKPTSETRYMTDAFGEEAVSFIDRNSSSPFFLYMAFNAVHTPMNATKTDLASVANIKDEKRRAYAAMTVALDRQVSGILEALRRHKLEENTMVVFMTDNGGPTAANTSSNGPLRGFKGQLYEGGIRVPFFLQWKGVLPAGTVYDHPITALDIFPTALAAAETTSTGGLITDGINLVPYLKKEVAEPPHASLKFRFHARQKWGAIREGDWKLVTNNTGSSSTWELYNLVADIGEKNNLAEAEPEKTSKLLTQWETWASTLQAPKWQDVPRSAEKKAPKAKAGKRGGKRGAQQKAAAKIAP